MTDSWRANAACKGMDPNLFVPGMGIIEKRRRHGRAPFEIDPAAAAACARCPVSAECAEWAEREDETLIVAAGRLRDGSRHRVATGLRKNLDPQCGTDSGYHHHRYLKERACDDCRRAHNDVERERARRKRSRVA